KSTMAYHIVNYVFSNNENHPYNLKFKEININNKSFKFIKNGMHPNFHLIDLISDKKNIEVSQIRKMIDYSNKSSFNNLPRIIIIDNLENLNNNSNNALLKVVEEPNEKIFFILIHNNNKRILDTLKSRCLTYKVNLTFDDSIYITNKLINENILNLLNIDLINYYNTPGDFVNLIKFSQLNNLDLKEFNLGNFLSLLINEKYYKKDDFMKSYIFNFIEIYFLKIFRQSIDKNNIINFYSKFIRKINDTNKFNLDQDSLFMELKSKILNG
nr:DNA polymerase III [Pelagibacterales bacterium]